MVTDLACNDAGERVNLTRKEIAQLVGISPRAVKQNEARLGLDRLKVRVNHKTIVYPARAAIAAIRRLGLEV